MKTASVSDCLSEEMEWLSESTPACVERGLIDLRHQNNK